MQRGVCLALFFLSGYTYMRSTQQINQQFAVTLKELKMNLCGLNGDKGRPARCGAPSKGLDPGKTEFREKLQKSGECKEGQNLEKELTKESEESVHELRLQM